MNKLINTYTESLKPKHLTYLLIFGMILTSASASAATAGGSMTVSATLVSSCSVSDSSIDFGNISALNVTEDVIADTGSTLQVACSTGTITPIIYSIPGPSPRILSGAGPAVAGTMAFNLSQTAGAPTDDLPATGVTGQAMAGFVADGAVHTVILYGRIPTASFIGQPVGPYSTTILINVDYS